MMMSSSASRREAAAKSSELGRAGGVDPPRPSAAAMARSGELPKVSAAATAATAAVRHEGWMLRYGRRKIGRSFVRTRYFVLDNKLLAYYKKQPKDNMVPVKALQIDGNCRVEDRGLKTHHGQMVYVLCIYNKKEKENQITMGAHDIEDALVWKKKLELLIDQQQDTMTAKNRKAFASLDFDMEFGGPLSFSDRDIRKMKKSPGLLCFVGQLSGMALLIWYMIGPRSLILGCQIRMTPTMLTQERTGGYLDVRMARSCSRAMRAVGVVEATCESIFGLIMSMDVTRYEWDCSFQYGSLVEEVDGHTAILYHRLQLNWFSMLVWPRDLCYVRYWRRNDDGSYVVLFRSTEHQNCGPQPGFVRAFIESGGFKISPLKCVNGRPRTQVQHLMQIDLKGWGVNYFSSFQYYSLLQMLNCVAGLREYFSQTDDIHPVPRIPVMSTMATVSSLKKDKKLQETDLKTKQADFGQVDNKNLDMIDEESEEDDDYQVPEANFEEAPTRSDSDAKYTDPIDLSCFSGIIRRDANEKSRNCWTVPDSKLFKVRSESFPHDKSKVPATKYLMELVAIDWLRDIKRMDHVARRKGCAAQVAAEKGMFTFVVNIQIPGSSHYSLVLYFVTRTLEKGSLLQRFADGDDDFRNSRLKLIPSVPKGSWIVRQSVGSTPCLLGKAVDCSYMRGQEYIEVDVDIGSSAVANGVLGLVFGVVTTLIVDMAFLIQANTYDELPEQLLGAARLSNIEPSSAIVPVLDK
uniref:START domain-containing protein n=1 Tax=Oryza meridionalis TaxID=40149 RepID=A0A0E0DVV8_9ORYZ